MTQNRYNMIISTFCYEGSIEVKRDEVTQNYQNLTRNQVALQTNYH